MVLGLLLWAAVTAFRALRSNLKEQIGLVPLVAVAAAMMAAAWWLVGGDATGSQLGNTLGDAFSSVWNIIIGSSGARKPFTAAPGYTDAPAERLVGIASVGILLATLPFGLWAIWKRRQIRSLMIVLWVVAFAYPATLAIRLGAQGAETSNRTSEFVFVGLGVGLALAFLRWIAPKMDGGRFRLLYQGTAACLIGFLFIGGLTVGWPSQARLPGQYEVGGGSRAIDYEGEQAARWFGRTHPRGTVILADTANKSMMVAYGGAIPQGGDVYGRAVGSLYFTPQLTRADRRTLRVDKIEYVVVDRRMSTALPRSGRYFDGGDPGGYTEPPSSDALDKFASSPRIDKVYSSGNIVIYSTERLLRVTK